MNVQKLKRLATIRPSNIDKKAVEGQRPIRLCNYTDVYYHDVVTSDIEFMEATASAGQISDFTIRAGDILITKDSETADDIGIPAFVPEPLEGVVCGYHLALIRPDTNRVDPRYLFWTLVGNRARDEFAISTTGVTRFGLRQSEIGNVTVTLRPMPEQRAIADFLDRETVRIDALIEKRQALRGVLDKRWAALLWAAITKGLNDQAPFKESHIAWVGEIPQHWTTPPLYATYEVQLGKMLNAAVSAGPDQAPYLRNVNVQWDRLDFEDLETMSFSPADRIRFALEPGDLLVCEGGEVGRAAIWQGELDECYYQKAVHRVRPVREGNTRFLMYSLWAAALMNLFNVEGNQSTIVHLTAEKLREHHLPTPPHGEQRAIVNHVDRTRRRILSLQSRLRDQVHLLRERRQALVTATVTGRDPRAQ